MFNSIAKIYRSAGNVSRKQKSQNGWYGIAFLLQLNIELIGYSLVNVRSRDNWFHPLPMNILFLSQPAFPGARPIHQLLQTVDVKALLVSPSDVSTASLSLFDLTSQFLNSSSNVSFICFADPQCRMHEDYFEPWVH